MLPPMFVLTVQRMSLKISTEFNLIMEWCFDGRNKWKGYEAGLIDVLFVSLMVHGV